MQTGSRRYRGKDIRVTSVSVECVKSFMKSEWYRVGQFVFRLWVIKPGMEGFFVFRTVCRRAGKCINGTEFPHSWKFDTCAVYHTFTAVFKCQI